MTAQVVVELEGLPRDEWLEARRGGIGSSDIAAICGLDKFRGPLAVWLDKCGEAIDEGETDRMRWGRRLEEPIAAEFAEQTGLRTQRPPAMYRHSEVPFAFASPDFFVGEKGSPKVDGLLEAKASGIVDEWENGPPLRVIYQATWQAHVIGVPTTWIAALLQAHDFRYWRLPYDAELAEKLVEIGGEFWSLVESKEPPAADGHPSTSKALARLYKDVQPEATVDLSAYRDLFAELGEAKKKVEAAEGEKAAIENDIKSVMGTATVGLVGGVEAATWNQIRGRIDFDAYLKANPDEVVVVEEFRKDPTRRFLVKKGIV